MIYKACGYKEKMKKKLEDLSFAVWSKETRSLLTISKKYTLHFNI
jgi:hypothetical protein